MQALRPRHRHPVPARRRNQAEWRVFRPGAMPLPVVVHLPAQLAVQPRILARHVVSHIGGARLHAAPSCLDRLHYLAAMPGVGAGEEQRLAPGGGERVTERGEDHYEEEQNKEEKHAGDEVQEPPLPRVAALGRRRRIGVTHLRKMTDRVKTSSGSRVSAEKVGALRWNRDGLLCLLNEVLFFFFFFSGFVLWWNKESEEFTEN